MTFSTFTPTDRSQPPGFALSPLRFSAAALFVERMVAASRARRERNFINRLRRLDAHLRRDLGLESAVLDALEQAELPAAPRRWR